jgi:hypothetical protein
MFMHSSREIILYTNGTFAYKRKNKSDKIKLMIRPNDIVKLVRKKNILTIITNYNSVAELKITNT